jgi:PAS domain S-box-containing protein
MNQSLYPRWRSVLQGLWSRLTEPSPSLTDPQERRNARLLASLLALTIVILLFGRVYRTTNLVYEPPFNVATIWINIIVLTFAYVMSRTAYHRLGAIIAVTLVSAVVFLQTMYRGFNPHEDLSNPAAWLVALLLLSSFVISWQATLALGVANLTGLLMLPRITSGITFFDVRFSVELIFALNLVIALAAYLREYDWRTIQARTRELIEGEKRYRTLFEAAFEGVVVHDDGITLEVNDAFTMMYGYSHAEVVGQPILNFIPREQHELILKNGRDNIMVYETMARRKDGTVFEMEVSVKRVVYKGRLLRIVAMRDITERKRAEGERIQLITERERGSVLRRFISDASHDLRQPLTTMSTSLYLLRRKVGQSEENQRHLDTLDAQVSHLTRIFEDLFAMARLDEPQLLMQRVLLDLDELVAQVVYEHQSIATQKQHQLRFEPCGQLSAVMGDYAELKRAISHIIVNAISYTHAGGQIVVRSLLQNQHAVVEVKDTGIGIHSEHLPLIFNRFYRVDPARQTETGGSGLGLAIAQKIIENHSGSIEVESLPNVGSNFRISLPLSTQSLAG